MGADGSILRRLTPNGFEVHYSGMSWSRDGTKLAFSMFSDPHEIISSDIYMMDVDGSNKINITNSPHMHESDFDISPEGSQMCLYRTSDEPLYKSGIYVINVDASNPTRLTDIRGGGCAWSPDGQKIAYSYESRYLAPGGETVADVYVMNADGSGKTNLTKNRAWDGNSEWSPDGTRIAFTSSRDGDPDIYTMDADGSDVTQVTNLSGDEQYPNWQPLTQKSRSMTVHPPYTGGPSLSLVASTYSSLGEVCSV
jgi:Tol biopolymer transport system component